MKKSLLYLVLMLLIVFICIRHINEKSIKPIDRPVQVVIEPNKLPKLESNIVTDINQAKDLAKIYQKNLVIIFGAEWCVYCEQLKKSLSSINILDNYIVCLVDIEKTPSTTKEFGVKSLPTSIIIKNNKEISRKVGYKKQEYELWLTNL